MRCFFAIEIDDTLRKRFQQVRATIVDGDPSWAGEKWVPAENLHVTLAFMPDVPQAEIGALMEAAGRALDALPSFTLTVAGVRAVPEPQRARMLWGSLREEATHAASLASMLRQVCASYVDAPADGSRPFSPHLTLCRARRPRRIAGDALAVASSLVTGAAAPQLSVSRVTLFSSTLGPTGPTYEPVGSVDLGLD